VCESKGKRSRATNNLALSVVLGAVAGALKFVLSGNPWYDTPKMRADGVEAERLDLRVRVNDKVGGVTLQKPHE
jgi:pyruvate/2-oxoglutarate dehydrogenase complex dihydrolipoamide acyltransferase (E2) component